MTPGARRGGDPEAGAPGRGQGGQAGRGEGPPEARPRGRAEGGRGQAPAGRGSRPMGAGFGAPLDPSLQQLANPKLSGKLVGKVTELRDGIAKIEVRGRRKGEGTPAEVGLARGFGGRGGRGAATPSGEASVAIDVTGSLWVDTARHRLVKLVLEGKSDSNAHLVAERGDREMEITTKRAG